VWSGLLSSGVSELKIKFSIPEGRPLPNFAPTWNGAPTDNLPVVWLDGDGPPMDRPADRASFAVVSRMG